jgi:hypothetical protein
MCRHFDVMEIFFLHSGICGRNSELNKAHIFLAHALFLVCMHANSTVQVQRTVDA